MSWTELCRDAHQSFCKLEPIELASALRCRFKAEHISKHFTSVDYTFKGQHISIEPNNCILIEFTSLQAQHPTKYPAKQYRLILLLSLHNLPSISNAFALELDTIRRKDNIDRVVVWSCHGFETPTLHTLKNSNTDVIYLREKDVATASAISHYVPVPDKDHNYALALNLAADLILKRLKKMFHLVLSEIAAPIYDDLYAKQKVATDEMMRYEERLVRSVIQRHLPEEVQRRTAVDVGCGTGRHTFELAKFFGRVYAFDFSPLMIAAAERRKAADDIRNVLFSVADLEHETIRDEGHFQVDGKGCVDLIVASFGLGSFIEDTTGMMRRFHGWLRDSGWLVISFYNSSSVVTEITPNWRDTSLSAHLEAESNTLRVELSPKTVFHIFCKPYSPEVRKSISDSFSIHQTSTYPTLMALMPNNLLNSQPALGLFRFVDEMLSEHKNYQYGHYVTIVAQKSSKGTEDALSRVKTVLDDMGANYSTISHTPVFTAEDAVSIVNTQDGLPIKTLLFRRKGTRILVAVLVPVRLRVDTTGLAKQIGATRLIFGTDNDVLKTGFPLGGLAPIGFLADTVSRVYVDRRILRANVPWVYTGAGDNTKTLKVRRDDLIAALGDYGEVDA